jgi:hypothetical protein
MSTIMEGSAPEWILGSLISWRFSVFGQKGNERIFPTVSFLGKSPVQTASQIAHYFKIITN